MTTPIFVGSRLDGCLIKDFAWPVGALITCIYRGENQLIPHGDTRLKAGDTLVIQLRGKNHIANQARINLAARQSAHD
jgi:NhaP-type Na+/H+ and K+/H+ antiporters with a unique C-terminal domain